MVDHPDGFGQGLRALAAFFIDEVTLGSVLTRVAELACESAPADMAGITMLVDGELATGVFTDPEAPEIDRAQYRTGHGPCLDAFRDQDVHVIRSTNDEERWPEFARACAEHGILSTLSMPVVARDRSLGALNLYSRETAVFDDGVITATRDFARQAAVVLTNVKVYQDARELNENLSQAMESRATIDQATGILLARGGMSPEQAFEVLVRASQRENRKLRDIAAEIVQRSVQRDGLSAEG